MTFYLQIPKIFRNLFIKKNAREILIINFEAERGA